MSLRYLTENNNYVIKYNSIPDVKSIEDCLTKTKYIYAYLSDRKTKAYFSDYEKFNDNLEKCLMKLGRRLIKKWQSQKK